MMSIRYCLSGQRNLSHPKVMGKHVCGRRKTIVTLRIRYRD